MKIKTYALFLCWLLPICSCSGKSIAENENENKIDVLVQSVVTTNDTDPLIKASEGKTQGLINIQEQQGKSGSNPNDSNRTYYLDSGQKVEVKGNMVVIFHVDGMEMIKNSKLIRRMDENSTCPSEGFIDIVTKGPYFTIEQQNCSGWHFIGEFITFKYSEIDGKFLLHKFLLQYMDRRDPEKDILEKIYTQKDFGEVFFEDVNKDSLY